MGFVSKKITPGCPYFHTITNSSSAFGCSGPYFLGECKCELLSKWVYVEVAMEDWFEVNLKGELYRFVSLDDVDLGQVCVDFALNCARKFFPPPTAEMQRTECLKSLREIAMPLAERPAQASRNYFSDVLDEGKLTEEKDDHLVSCTLESNTLGMSPFSLKKEVEEILELLKSTWCILGITKTIHYTCYAWVLFRQFVITGEQRILQYVIEQLKKSFLLAISKWADKQLGDNHLNYAEAMESANKVLHDIFNQICIYKGDRLIVNGDRLDEVILHRLLALWRGDLQKTTPWLTKARGEKGD
ncbi:hypothetical protein KY290_030486 [Solanum tuberosum]|uniref:Uncharacterized protein n=1 Tax=Solanum tuberosum TaxID=4113 RepID=A0ABQ7UQG1_SOLTU|nr:hypothetical protein KY290_030486 [Solanum tuberosum]